jgi:4'-phosphopantetheinyl transferase EntD
MATRAQPDATLLGQLFVCPTSGVTALPALVDELYAEEQSLIARALPKRQAEFRAGRACARRALASMGVPPGPLLAQDDRTPKWPSGIVGSITHTDGFCAAVVARERDARGVGLDAEPDAALDPSLEAAICTPAERRWLDANAPADRGRLGRLVFSAKEAFYKCQYPLTKTFLDFLEVELIVILEEECFRIGKIYANVTLNEVRGARGRFRCSGGLILTGVTL